MNRVIIKLVLRFFFLPSFLSYAVFESIVRKQLQKIKAPAKECLKNVNSIVERITLTVIEEHLNRFEPLKMEVNNLMNRERKKAEKSAVDALDLIFAMENLVFTQDGNFARLMQDIEKEDQEEKDATLNPAEQQGKSLVSGQLRVSADVSSLCLWVCGNIQKYKELCWTVLVIVFLL